MKIKPIYIILLLFALVATACGSSSTPTAEPPPAEPLPTQVPPTSGDPVWDRVTSAGKIIIGTSADYEPFEYYDASYQIIGFDASLARELGARLGLQIELVDIAFEGLTTALQIGQIDVAIAAMSVTPERQAIVDFTNVYYTGQDSVLTRQGSGIATITAPPQLAQYRVGVQKGSVYANWLQTSLVDAGLMPAANLLTYAKPQDAVRDLKENRNDLVVMDTLPAKEYLLAGGVELVGQSLNTQLFAIALPKGAATLQAQLNEALTQMQNDGTIATLANQFLKIDISGALPISPPTPIPGPTATPAGCHDGSAFVQDVTVPDGTEMKPGQDFDKTWRLKNTGTCTWDSKYKIDFVQGDRMGGSAEAVKGTVKPGATYDMTIDQQAPNSPGKYGGSWHMVNGHGVPFGERVWVKITVPGAPAPTAVPPTATSVPPVQPTLPPTPVIEYLTVEPATVQKDGTVLVSWAFSGQDLALATLTRTDPDGTLVPLYGGADVPSPGTYDDMMKTPGTVTYTLKVDSEFGGSNVLTVIVTVTDGS